MAIKLSDLQLVLLSTAAARADRSLLPPPESVAGELPRIRKTMPALLKRQFVAEQDVATAALAWREDGERHVGVIITEAGLAAIGAGEPAHELRPMPMQASEQASPKAEAEQPAPARPTKAAAVLALLRRDEGATLAELVEATGWLPHTTRAALTGLRKKGHAIQRDKRGNASCYHLAEAA